MIQRRNDEHDAGFGNEQRGADSSGDAKQALQGIISKLAPEGGDPAGDPKLPRVIATAESGRYAYAVLRCEVQDLRKLTPRQMDVARRIRRGRTNKEIARELGLKVARIATIFGKIKWHWRVESRVEVGIKALFLDSPVMMASSAGIATRPEAVDSPSPAQD